MVEAFTGSGEAAEGALIDTDSVTSGTDEVVTAIATATIGTGAETIMAGDITTGSAGGQGDVSGSMDGEGWVLGRPARGVWWWAAWWRAARRRFFSLCAGPR